MRKTYEQDLWKHEIFGSSRQNKTNHDKIWKINIQ